MLTFSQYINENYKNFIGPKSVEDRRKYADQVWDILTKSYAHIGGIKGSGFSSKEDMIQNVPFWKLYTKNDKVLAAIFYKDNGGRKTVAIATDGSEMSARELEKVFKASMGVAYGEQSGRALGKLMKTLEWDHVKRFIMTPEDASKASGKKNIPVEEFGYENLDKDDKYTYDKYPLLRPYMYVRNLGGEMHMKVSIGTPNIKIK